MVGWGMKSRARVDGNRKMSLIFFWRRRKLKTSFALHSYMLGSGSRRREDRTATKFEVNLDAKETRRRTTTT